MLTCNGTIVVRIPMSESGLMQFLLLLSWYLYRPTDCETETVLRLGERASACSRYSIPFDCVTWRIRQATCFVAIYLYFILRHLYTSSTTRSLYRSLHLFPTFWRVSCLIRGKHRSAFRARIEKDRVYSSVEHFYCADIAQYRKLHVVAGVKLVKLWHLAGKGSAVVCGHFNLV